MRRSPRHQGDFYPWYVVVVLTFAFTVAFIDRQILSLLVQPIRRDLGISDTQISLLAGFAFAVFYSVLGVPIARLADRRSRRAIISVGVFLWSLMTAACGLAKSFAGLFAARVGVGVGEATLSPAAYSMRWLPRPAPWRRPVVRNAPGLGVRQDGRDAPARALWPSRPAPRSPAGPRRRRSTAKGTGCR